MRKEAKTGETLRYSQDNVIALTLAVRLASSIPDVAIKDRLYELLGQVFHLQTGPEDIDLSRLSEKVSLKNIEYSRVDEEFFHAVVEALLRERPISIAYYSPHTRKKTVRTIFPLHLIHYMGSWHIVAYCTTRKGLRDFALSRIKSVDPTAEEVLLPSGLPSLKEYTRRHFGIMQGGPTTEVSLRFSPALAGWIAEQIWHPRQSLSYEPDGSLTMRLPVADLREIRRSILSHGAEVTVLEPKELAEEIKEEIRKMKRLYE